MREYCTLNTHTLNDWLSTPQGVYLLKCEQALFDHGVADIFGFNALQLNLAEYDLLRANRMPLRLVAGNEAGVQVRLDMSEFPFGEGSLDLLLLPHVLEFHDHPHQVLREVARMLRPGGSVIISGFNPRSLWGIWRVLSSRTHCPWRGNFIALSKLKDWLALLGFEVVTGRFTCYAPPLIKKRWLSYFNFMELAGDRWWAAWGGVYFLQAIKHVPGGNMIKPKWNEGLVSQLLPRAPKLNRKISQRTKLRQK